jgi:segregation and condensation protein B
VDPRGRPPRRARQAGTAGTTKTFLDYFGLKRLDELPPLSELKDIGELEPQLPFAAAIPAGAASASTSAATALETMPGEDSDIEHEQDHEDMAADAMSDSNGSDEDTTSPALPTPTSKPIAPNPSATSKPTPTTPETTRIPHRRSRNNEQERRIHPPPAEPEG